MPVASKPKPSDRRPYRKMHESGPEMVTTSVDESGRIWRQTWKQVGWQGQTGAFYSLDEDPAQHEPGSYAPLWALPWNEEIVADTDA